LTTCPCTPGEIIRCPSGTGIWCRPDTHFHMVWLPTVRAGSHSAARRRLSRTRAGTSLTTMLVYPGGRYLVHFGRHLGCRRGAGAISADTLTRVRCRLVGEGCDRPRGRGGCGRGARGLTCTGRAARDRVGTVAVVWLGRARTPGDWCPPGSSSTSSWVTKRAGGRRVGGLGVVRVIARAHAGPRRRSGQARKAWVPDCSCWEPRVGGGTFSSVQPWPLGAPWHQFYPVTPVTARVE
jgi:hypothetical protein